MSGEVTRAPLRKSLQGFGTTIFAEMTRLAIEHQAVNLGQGFPDFAGPQFMKDAAVRAIRAEHNQYARSAGIPELVQAISRKLERHWGLSYDAMDEVTVLSGCTEGIHIALMALCEPGDEVVILEPYYDSYAACVAMSGATPRFVRLHSPELRWKDDELAAAFNERTRVVMVNTPHNPTGRVFDRAELTRIADLAKAHDAYVIADEVYDHLVFEGEHIPIASLPDMRERTICLNSMGKSYSMTGWRIGYAAAPAEVTKALRTVHQFVTFSSAAPLQHAVVDAVDAPQSYYDLFVADYRERREHLRQGLTAAGFELLPQEGTYFQCADIRPFGYDNDVDFCMQLIEKAGVVAIPPSAFHAGNPPVPYVRFAFCKELATLDEAARRLQVLAG